ncbi:MAG TPA: hypothetical protein VFN35_03085, partial [Ktedonobacteraceae bacterium]|nr:hypothetical protein [Ktedonobacteraceae bacterium]
FSLDGLNYLSSYNPDDYAAIRWINSNILGDPGIIEANGSDYSDYGRVSAYTGLPSPMNWIGHELQWRINWMNRGDNSIDFNRRADDVRKIYTSADSNEVLNLMKYYGAKYIYVGALEQATYQGVDLQHFNSFMHVVYHKGGVTIYQVP